MTVGDHLVKRLKLWGVKRIFGYPGDGINGIVAALDRSRADIDFVQVRHEEQAAFMATAHAKFTGELGVALATSGPGAIHLLNGLYDAKADHVPVLAIMGQAATTALGGDYQQEVDLPSLFKDVASEYLVTVTNPAQMRYAVDRAVRIARAHLSVTALIVPKDVQEEAAVETPPHAHDTLHSSATYSAPRSVPYEADLRAAAEILNASQRVALLVGAGALGAADAVIAVADRLGAGCAKALLGKAALPDHLPWVTGTLGLLGTRASSDMMNGCDALLMVGTSFPYAEFLPKEGKARGIGIDVDARRLGMRYPTEIDLVGDAAATLQALLPFLEAKTDTAWRDGIAKNKRDERDVGATRAAIVTERGVNPELVALELNKRLPDDAIVACDAGSTTNFMARHLDIRTGMKYSLSGGLATMGSAVPYAIAAKFAFPERIALALTGDGAMQMNGLGEMITVAKYWKTWADPRLVFMVSNNRDLNQVSWEMRVESGEPKFPGSQDLPDFPYARYAELLGFIGIRVERPEDLGAAWDTALSADRPALLDIVTDPNHELLPPHISVKQGLNFARAFGKGDPDEAGGIVESVKSMVAAVIPTHHAETPG